VTNINVGGTVSSVVAYPPSGGTPHAYLFNAGPNNAHLGGISGVSSATGMQLRPQCRMDLSNFSGTIYGIAGGNQQTPYGTITANTAYGGTALTGVTGGTAFTAGMTVIIDPGTAKQEITSVASSNAGTVNVSPAMAFVHGSAATFSQWNPNITTLQITPGAT
jgi:hypothetical protein